MGVDFEDILFGGIVGLVLSLFLGPILWAKGLFIKKETVEGQAVDESAIKAKLDQVLAGEAAKS